MCKMWVVTIAVLFVFAHVGGSRSPLYGLPDSYYQGFEGCVASLVVDNIQAHLVEHRVTPGKVSFCDE